jgi:hypothetical protein
VFTQPKLATFVPDGIARKIHQLRTPAHCMMAFLTRCAKELRTAIRVEQYRRARDAYRVSGAAQPMQLRLLSQSTA